MAYRIDVPLVDEVQDQGSPIGGKRIRESVTLSAERVQRQEALLWALSILDKLLPDRVTDRLRPDMQALEQQGRTEDAHEDAYKDALAAFIVTELRSMISSIVAAPEQMWLNGNAQSTMEKVREIVRECIRSHG